MNEVKMSDTELQEYLEFKRAKDLKLKKEKIKENRLAYSQMVESAVEDSMKLIMEVTQLMSNVKHQVYSNFQDALSIKSELYGTKVDEQYSHTFTNKDCTKRIILGVNTIDGYKDTVNDGIQKVKEYIESLVTDDTSKELVDVILRLLSNDNKGKLKAQNILKLRQLANKSNNELFIDGVRIIEESYQPTVTKTYLRAEVKNSVGKWENVPLTFTEV